MRLSGQVHLFLSWAAETACLLATRDLPDTFPHLARVRIIASFSNA
jgi:hypothetical protein